MSWSYASRHIESCLPRSPPAKGYHGAMNQPAPPRVSIIEQPEYRNSYANSVQVRASVWDFFLQFGTVAKQTNEEVEIHAVQGVYLSPQQAKALHTVLSDNLAQYERAFGPIKIDANQQATGGSVQGPQGGSVQ